MRYGSAIKSKKTKDTQSVSEKTNSPKKGLRKKNESSSVELNKKIRDTKEELQEIDVNSLRQAANLKAESVKSSTENQKQIIKPKNESINKQEDLESVKKNTNKDITKVSKEKEKEIFDTLERVLPNFIDMFIKDKKKDVMSIDFKSIKAKITGRTITFLGKINKLKLSYTLGQRKIFVNSEKPLNPAQVELFVVWVLEINKDIADKQNIGTYILKRREG